jgi:hypothetical protein
MSPLPATKAAGAGHDGRDQALRNAVPMYGPDELAAGVYDTTDTFRSIGRHSCVCRRDTMELIAVTGHAHDAASQRDADLFAAAPGFYAALVKIASMEPYQHSPTCIEMHRIANEAVAKFEGRQS